MSTAEESRPYKLWEIALGSTAVLGGSCFFIGYWFVVDTLVYKFGYEGPLLAVYSYYDILFKGLDLTLIYISLRIVIAFSLAYLAFAKLPSGVRKWLGRLSAVAYFVFSFLFPFILGASEGHLMTWLIAHEFLTSTGLLFCLIYCLLLIIHEEMLARARVLLRVAMIIAACGFLLWLLPKLLVGAGFRCSSMTTIEFADGRHQTLEYINFREGIVILGDSKQRQLYIVKPEPGRPIVIGPCSYRTK